MQKLYTAYEWIDWVTKQHPRSMDFDLTRIRTIANRLTINFPNTQIITVAGTNGKGSTCAGLEGLYLAAGYQVGTFTSPYLFTPHEQIKLNGQNVDDAMLCQTFATVYASMAELTVTQFELMTLAAFYIFMQQALDIVILEVGLGGRLDAVNIIDANLAIITSIDLDHTQLLGDTRAAIALEKAGILREKQLAIYGDPDPPPSLIERAAVLQSKMHYLGKDFTFAMNEANWSWASSACHYENLPMNGLACQNMAVVLMAITLLQSSLPVSVSAIYTGLREVKLLGRQELLAHQPQLVFDVAHNPAAVKRLAERIVAWRQYAIITGDIYIVFSMLADKAIAECVAILNPIAAAWFVAPVDDPRSASQEQLVAAFDHLPHAHVVETLDDAYTLANRAAKLDDCILVCGSFRAVGYIRQRF